MAAAPEHSNEVSDDFGTALPEDMRADVLRLSLITGRTCAALLIDAWREYEERQPKTGYCHICLSPAHQTWARTCAQHHAQFRQWSDTRRRQGHGSETVRSFIEMMVREQATSKPSASCTCSRDDRTLTTSSSCDCPVHCDALGEEGC
jgi:hypothetical protein